MKPSSTDISLKYLGALSEAVRKKNSAKFGSKKGVEVVEPDAMNAEPEMDDDDISALLSATDEAAEGSGEHRMAAEDEDQETMGETPESPTMMLFKKKSKPLFRG